MKVEENLNRMASKEEKKQGDGRESLVMMGAIVSACMYVLYTTWRGSRGSGEACNGRQYNQVKRPERHSTSGSCPFSSLFSFLLSMQQSEVQ